MTKKQIVFALFFSVILAGGALFYLKGRGIWWPAYSKMRGARTVHDVRQTYGPQARQRLAPHFERAGVSYPPETLSFLAIKDTARFELWANKRLIRTYPIKALSGTSGPKLREGDRQVPEGLYRLEGLNPNSSYHLSMKINYPNTLDLEHAKAEGRADAPGSNIFIHGKAASIGCLAMGDEAIEELFILVSDVGYPQVKVLIAPTDPRINKLDAGERPSWVHDLYRSLTQEFTTYQ